jgi:hypothetical protein
LHHLRFAARSLMSILFLSRGYMIGLLSGIETSHREFDTILISFKTVLNYLSS